jgi:hypothetical protein
VRTVSFHLLVAALAATMLVGATLVALAPRGGLPYAKASFSAGDAEHPRPRRLCACGRSRA